MIHLQNVKSKLILAPVSVAGGATATVTTVNRDGYHYARVVIATGLVGANGVTTLKLQESDTDGSYADVTGGGFTALVDADDGKMLVAYIDLRKRKKWLNLVITNGATNASLLAAWIDLDRGEQAPSSATARGFAQQLII